MAPTLPGTHCWPVPPCHKAAEAYSGADAVTVSDLRNPRAGL
jgi:hypothetical protein